MTLMGVKIEATETGRGTKITVDGVDMSRSANAYTLSARADSITKLNISLVSLTPMVIEGVAEIDQSAFTVINDSAGVMTRPNGDLVVQHVGLKKPVAQGGRQFPAVPVEISEREQLKLPHLQYIGGPRNDVALRIFFLIRPQESLY